VKRGKGGKQKEDQHPPKKKKKRQEVQVYKQGLQKKK
jgi:hypothetical protein